MKALKADQIRLNVINRKWLPRILNDIDSRPQKDDFNKVLQMLITSDLWYDKPTRETWK